MKNFFKEGVYYNGEGVVDAVISDKNKMKWTATYRSGKVYKIGTVGNCAYFVEVQA